ncbi:YqgE/AlgH family protein [Halosquirtibacter laminarini]|uniref:YqgE/AlgH family protein n=1 Tax=Halosquirtibacter laminarini TaxID=3374600 RepID=A0AC61NNL7_9BACT|nr:YqgE/AlgH family protein [Prolixibacteraceae bacterium]
MKIINKDFFKINNKRNPKQGDFMIAEPFMIGRFFSRSVIMISEYTNAGIVGFVLNKIVPYKVTALVDNFPDTDCDLFYGGPLDTDRLFYIHTLGNILEGSLSITDDLYWGGDLESLKKMIESGYANRHNVRFFLGYSGWSAEQLKEEMNTKNWKMVPSGSVPVFPPNMNLWEDLLKNLGEHYSNWRYFPRHPSLN